ncbi:TPA: hypothetical protein ACH3X3_006564 [Trebouxia sp. C0006]
MSCKLTRQRDGILSAVQVGRSIKHTSGISKQSRTSQRQYVHHLPECMTVQELEECASAWRIGPSCLGLAVTGFSPIQQTDPTPGCELDMPLLLFPPYALTLQTSKQPPKAPRRQAAARMWSAARNASPLVPGRGMPQAIKQMLQSQQLHAQLLQRHMTQPQVVHPQQLHLQLPQLSQRQMTQLHISQPQGCHSQWPQTQMLQSHAQTLQCQLQMLQSQT